jgi:hypothetical protein
MPVRCPDCGKRLFELPVATPRIFSERLFWTNGKRLHMSSDPRTPNEAERRAQARDRGHDCIQG